MRSLVARGVQQGALRATRSSYGAAQPPRALPTFSIVDKRRPDSREPPQFCFVHGFVFGKGG